MSLEVALVYSLKMNGLDGSIQVPSRVVAGGWTSVEEALTAFMDTPDLALGEGETVQPTVLERRRRPLGPLLVNGKPIPQEIADGPVGEFARYCGATDPVVLAMLDAEDEEPSS